MPTDTPGDEQLARRACTLALRTAAAIVHSRDEAADIAQDVAIDVLRSVDRLRDPAAFDAWVHRITVRHALRHLRRRSRRRRTETPLALLLDHDLPPAPAGDHAALLSARDTLAAAVAQLPPRQRIALALRYVHDLPDAQIAAALRCREGTVHALLSRARAALREDPSLSHLAPAITSGASR